MTFGEVELQDYISVWDNVDINCSVDWPGNTLYQIDPGSKPRACMSDLEESAVGGLSNIW